MVTSDGVSDQEKRMVSIRKRDTLAIGGAKLKNIVYSFWKGGFESVWIDFEGEENLKAIKKELFERSERPLSLRQVGIRWLKGHRENNHRQNVIEHFMFSWAGIQRSG